jgi:hypothetical protein
MSLSRGKGASCALYNSISCDSLVVVVGSGNGRWGIRRRRALVHGVRMMAHLRANQKSSRIIENVVIHVRLGHCKKLELVSVLTRRVKISLQCTQSGLSKLKCLWIHSLVGYWVDYRLEVICPCLFLYNDD